MQDWYSPDIEVIIRDSHEDTGLWGQIGVVRGVTPGKCSLECLWGKKRGILGLAQCWLVIINLIFRHVFCVSQ